MPKFFSCPVDAENGFKLDDWMSMEEVMEKNQPKISPISSIFLDYENYFF